MHLDESGVRVAGKLHWLNVAGAAGLTFERIHPRRGCEAMDEFDIIPNLQGYAVHDNQHPSFDRAQPTADDSKRPRTDR